MPYTTISILPIVLCHFFRKIPKFGKIHSKKLKNAQKSKKKVNRAGGLQEFQKKYIEGPMGPRNSMFYVMICHDIL